MSIKYNLGKLTLAPSYEEFVEREVISSSITLLKIELEYLKINATLPFHHRDPFDRIIIAQSMAENIPVITVDSVFNKYSIILI
jgi:PIN domain nuclease of toxin-antitoxin system